MQTPESPFTDTNGAAQFLGRSPRTMERDRVTGEGPAFHKFGRKVVYKIDDLTEWASTRRRTSTSDTGKQDD